MAVLTKSKTKKKVFKQDLVEEILADYILATSASVISCSFEWKKMSKRIVAHIKVKDNDNAKTEK